MKYTKDEIFIVAILVLFSIYCIISMCKDVVNDKIKIQNEIKHES